MPITTSAPGPTVTPPPITEPPKGFPGYGEMTDLGANWRLKFADADGIPLNMLSFEVIDFGAIAFKEIFQNVKTILATPIFSAALERLLGVDQSIVDRPMNDAQHATVAILQALYFWEPRAQAVDISFDGDVIAGHLICKLQLNIHNVIYGTDTPYARNNVFGKPTITTQELPPMNQPVLIPGPPGKTGRRGSLWFTGASDPDSIEAPAPSPYLPNDMYLNTTSGDVFQFREATGTLGVTQRWEKVQAPWATGT